MPSGIEAAQWSDIGDNYHGTASWQPNRHLPSLWLSNTIAIVGCRTCRFWHPDNFNNISRSRTQPTRHCILWINQRKLCLHIGNVKLLFEFCLLIGVQNPMRRNLAVLCDVKLHMAKFKDLNGEVFRIRNVIANHILHLIRNGTHRDQNQSLRLWVTLCKFQKPRDILSRDAVLMAEDN